MSEATVINNTVQYDGNEFRFSSHLAAFEAMNRLSDPNWRPVGGGSYFTDGDADMFASMTQ